MTKYEKMLVLMYKVIMRIKESHGTGDNDTLGNDDLCVHPGVDLPEGYKVLKFEVFNDIKNPIACLRRYCDQMIREEKIRHY